MYQKLAGNNHPILRHSFFSLEEWLDLEQKTFLGHVLLKTRLKQPIFFICVKKFSDETQNNYRKILKI